MKFRSKPQQQSRRSTVPYHHQSNQSLLPDPEIPSSFHPSIESPTPQVFVETSPLHSHHAMYTSVSQGDLEQPFTPHDSGLGEVEEVKEEKKDESQRGGKEEEEGEEQKLLNLASKPFYIRRPLLTALLSLFLFLLIVLFLLFFLSDFFFSSSPSSPVAPPSTCDIFCYGSVLSTMQLSGLFNDSKSYVDMPLLHSPSVVLSSFNSLPDHSRSSLVSFLVQNFQAEGTDVLPWKPLDWQAEPAIIESVKDAQLKEWTRGINSLWRVLGRQIAPDVYENPDRHTLLPLKHPYMIVPGGRFREFYYWDSYWIVRGLLLSNMYNTSAYIIENLVGLVETFGFVPNGSRQYYLTRSQPPFLTLMVDAYYNATGDVDMVRHCLGTLEKEYSYWMTVGKHAVEVEGEDGQKYVMNRYYTSVDYPRPESFIADEHTAAMYVNYQQPIDPPPSPHPPPPPSSLPSASHARLFSELTASAETGWDFSSRWFADRHNLSTAETTDLIPVDLNSVLFAVEVTLAKFHRLLGEGEDKVEMYRRAAEVRKRGIQELLWDEPTQQWQDYDWVEKVRNGGTGLLSNFIPLWVKCYNTSTVNESLVIDSLLTSGLVLPGGLVTSLHDAGSCCQWDYPNAWPPLQHMIAEGILTSEFTPRTERIEQTLIQLKAGLPEGFVKREFYTPAENTIGLFSSSSSSSPFSSSSSSSSLSFPFYPAPSSPYGPLLSYYLCSQWLYSTLLAYNSTGFMLEKYYAPTLGSPGGGGEYQLQTGFGWTNGVALLMLDRYGGEMDMKEIETREPIQEWGDTMRRMGLKQQREMVREMREMAVREGKENKKSSVGVGVDEDARMLRDQNAGIVAGTQEEISHLRRSFLRSVSLPSDGEGERASIQEGKHPLF